MSGPKTSVLSLSFVTYSNMRNSEKHRWTENEILLTLAAMQKCETAIENLLKAFDSLNEAGMCSDMFKAAAEEIRETFRPELESIDAAHEFSKKELREMKKEGAVDVNRSVDHSDKISTLSPIYLEFYKASCERSLEEKVSIARECARRSLKMQKKKRQLEVLLEIERENMTEQLASGASRQSYYLSFRSLKHSEDGTALIEKINETLMPLVTMSLSADLLKQLQVLKEKAKEVQDVSYLGNFYQLIVRPFAEECRKYDAFYEAHIEEFEEYRNRYLILCSETGKIPQEKEFSAEALEFYRTEADRLEQAVLKDRARRKVMQTVDEVMRDMGYDLIGSREFTRKNGKTYNNELFVYDQGTAINVMQSSDGMLTMELGGLDHEDRLPSDEEARDMSEQMVTFCTDYKRISAELKRRGLDIKNVSLLEPDPQYATIINLDDYSVIAEPVTITEAKRTERAEETKRPAAMAEES